MTRSWESPEEAVIEPRRGRREEPIAPRVVMAFTVPDYRRLGRLAAVPGRTREFAGCPFRPGRWQDRDLTLVGPAPGSPYAVMVLEKLIALGAQAVVAVGWCGSLQAEVGIGEVVRPTTALSEEGTSAHYPLPEGVRPEADAGLVKLLGAGLQRCGQPHRAGRVWTTDALFRETAGKVEAYGRQGVVAVDMEMSALFTLGAYRRVAVAGLLVVSDTLTPRPWRHGLRDPRLKSGREHALRVALDAISAWEETGA